MFSRAACASVEDSRKKQQYISKLKLLSKQLASSNESTPISNVQRLNEVSSTAESPPRQTIDSPATKNEANIKQQKEEKQMRAYMKLRALISQLEIESSTSTPKTPASKSNCVTPESTHSRSHSPTSISGSSQNKARTPVRNTFNLQSLLKCCGEMNVEDILAADDSIDQLLLVQECDDTELVDEWSLDVSSAPSEQSRRDLNITNVTDDSGNLFFLEEPCEMI